VDFSVHYCLIRKHLEQRSWLSVTQLFAAAGWLFGLAGVRSPDFATTPGLPFHC